MGGNILFGSVLSNNGDSSTLYETLKSTKPGVRHYGESFHNYTLIRHKDRIIYKVDEETYGKIDNPAVLADINKYEVN